MKARRNVPDDRGFIALVTALIISVALVSIVLVAGTGSFYARMDSLGMLQSMEARSLATSCVKVALLALATSTDPDSFVISDREVAIESADEQYCTIDSLSQQSGAIIIRTHASVSDSYGAVEARASLPPTISILSWNER